MNLMLGFWCLKEIEVDKCMKSLYLENRGFFSLQNSYSVLSVQQDFRESHRPVLGQGGSYSNNEIYTMNTNLRANAYCGEAVDTGKDS